MRGPVVVYSAVSPKVMSAFVEEFQKQNPGVKVELEGIETRGNILLSSGRISSEMLLKAAVMGIPIVCSRTSPTALAVGLAERLNITAVGYIRQDTLNVYSHPWRVRG